MGEVVYSGGGGQFFSIKNGEIIVTFSVSPELGRMAIRQGVEMPFVVWSILRASVVAKNHSGHFTKKEAIQILGQEGLHFTARHWQRIWQQGLSLFWGMKPNQIFIRSYRRVSWRFEAFRKPCDANYRDENYFVQIQLSGGIQNVRAELYRAWFLQFEEKTISRDTLRDLFGLSHDQQRACESQLANRLLIKTNYAQINLETYKENPQELPEHHFTIAYEREIRFDEDVDSVVAIHYQLSNTFLARATSENPFPVSDAPNRAKRAMRKLNRHSDSLLPKERTFWLKWSQFEALGTLDSFIRVFYQGKKRLWLTGHYL